MVNWRQLSESGAHNHGKDQGTSEWTGSLELLEKETMGDHCSRHVLQTAAPYKKAAEQQISVDLSAEKW